MLWWVGRKCSENGWKMFGNLKINVVNVLVGWQKMNTTTSSFVLVAYSRTNISNNLHTKRSNRARTSQQLTIFRQDQTNTMNIV